MIKSLFNWLKSIQLRQMVITLFAVVSLLAATAEQGYDSRKVNDPALFDVERSSQSIDATRSTPPNQATYPYTSGNLDSNELIEQSQQRLRNAGNGDNLIDNAQQKLKNTADNLRDRFDQSSQQDTRQRLSEVSGRVEGTAKGARRTFNEGTNKVINENKTTRNRNAE